MKKSKFLIGAFSLLAFAACSDDKSIIDEPVSGDDTYAYINVNLLSPTAGSRADKFQDGTSTENTISNIVMVFYGPNGNYLSSASMTAGEIEFITPDPNNDETPNVEKVKRTKVKVSLSGGTIPSSMMVFANPVTPDDINWNLSAIPSKTRNSYTGRNGNFAMNNSVYFKDGELQRPVAVGKANFYQTATEEATATDVDVYLERLAAKVKLSAGATQESTLEGHEGELDGKQLKYVVDGWGLNATAKKCYLSKFFDLDNFEGGYTYINNQLKTKFPDWNEKDNHRSYWAISPDYNKSENPNGSKYPYVSDQANGNSILNYYSFTSFLTGGDNHKAIGSSTYTLENTRNSAFFNNNDYKNSSLVSAVVVGHYTINNEVKDFYVQGHKIYLEADYLTAMAKAANVIVKANGNPLDESDADNLSKIFEIYHPTKPNIGDATKGVEENKVTIKINRTASELAQYKYKNGSDAAEDITASNFNKIDQDLYNNCGLSDKYKDGKAYFNIPIRHLAAEPGENEPLAPGYFGIVRNHVYDITVSGFAELSFDTLGEGVRDPEDPIVPPTDPDDKYGIKAKIRVLSWRLVSQSVTLGGQNIPSLTE